MPNRASSLCPATWWAYPLRIMSCGVASIYNDNSSVPAVVDATPGTGRVNRIKYDFCVHLKSVKHHYLVDFVHHLGGSALSSKSVQYLYFCAIFCDQSRHVEKECTFKKIFIKCGINGRAEYGFSGASSLS